MRYIVVEEMGKFLNGDLHPEVLPRCRAVATLEEAKEAGLRLAREYYHELPAEEVSDVLAEEFCCAEGSQGIALVFDGSGRTTFPVPYNGESMEELGSDAPLVVIPTASL